MDGQVVARTRARDKRRRHKLEWRGTFRDPVTGERRPARRGTYEAALVVRDVAGNEATETFPVRVRFIELDQKRVRGASSAASCASPSTQTP